MLSQASVILSAGGRESLMSLPIGQIPPPLHRGHHSMWYAFYWNAFLFKLYYSIQECTENMYVDTSMSTIKNGSGQGKDGLSNLVPLKGPPTYDLPTSPSCLMSFHISCPHFISVPSLWVLVHAYRNVCLFILVCFYVLSFSIFHIYSSVFAILY